MQNQQNPWNPLTVEEISFLFFNAPFPWWIAGGIALELAVGHRIRKHADIDVLVLRRDQLAARELLGDWDCWAADPPGHLRVWPIAEKLNDDVHDVWCRKTSQDDWRMQLMFDESDGTDWVSRRDNGVRAPVQEITATTSSGIHYLAPHIQLYYKAQAPRAKDEVDFEAVLASGTSFDTAWLRAAISHSYGPQHPWFAKLT